jgi:hypothetical protein
VSNCGLALKPIQDRFIQFMQMGSNNTWPFVQSVIVFCAAHFTFLCENRFLGGAYQFPVNAAQTLSTINLLTEWQRI